MSYRYQFTLNEEPVEEWVNERLCKEIPQEWYDVYNKCIEGLEKIFKPYNSIRCAKCNYGNPDKRPNCGCCYNCASSTAFTDGYPEEVKLLLGIKFDSTTGYDFQKIADDENCGHWNHDDDGWGFFDPVEHRCAVPRHLRSQTCLGYFCSRVYSRESDEMTRSVAAIMNVVRDIRRNRRDPNMDAIEIVDRVYRSKHVDKMVKRNIGVKSRKV